MFRQALFVALLSWPLAALAQPNGMVVDRATQAKRDEGRQEILQRELQGEQALLRKAQDDLTAAESRQAPAQTLSELKGAVSRHSNNIELLRRELAQEDGRVVKVAMAPVERPAPLSLPGASPSVSLKDPRREAMRGRGNPRLVVFAYDRNNTYPIYLMDALNTHFEFPEGEYVKTLSVSNCGQDSPFWTCSISEDRRHIWIKPKGPDLTNVGTIVTNRRVYEVSLHAVAQGRDWYQRVTWEGGWADEGFFEFRDQAGAGKASGGAASASTPAQPGSRSDSPEKLRFTYAIEGSAPFRPQMVFDDGKFTWIRLGPNVQELPALFVLSGDDVELVNYSQRGEYLLVNRLAPGFLLKLGKAEVRVRNQSYGGGG